MYVLIGSIPAFIPFLKDGGPRGVILADTCVEVGGWLMVAVNKQYNA